MGALQQRGHVGGERDTHSSAAIALIAVAVLACWSVLAYVPGVPGDTQFWVRTGRTLAVGFFVFAAALGLIRCCQRRSAPAVARGAAIALSAMLTVAARILVDVSAPATSTRVIAISGEFLLGLAWAALALRTRQLMSLTSWGRAALLAMAACETLRAVSDAGAGSVHLLAIGAQLLCSVLVVAVATAPDGLRPSRSLAQALDELAALQQRQRERLHDARSALTGVLGATSLLASRAPELDAQQLRALVVAEIDRLLNMLDLEATEPVTEFDLAECVNAVVLAQRLRGARISADLAPALVTGQPRATATAIDNLLRNAGLHAPGAQVWVRTVVGSRTVYIVVEDDGPGIADEDLQRIVLPGVRGSETAAPGNGLGLHIAASAMRAQSGSLRVSRRPGGGTRVVCTLPLANESAASATGSAAVAS